MPVKERGFSTVECLVALVIFSVGALGAAATVALGVRTAANGTRSAAATRLAGEAVESLRIRLRLGQHGCAALSPGFRIGPSGESVSWALVPADRGVGVTIIATYVTPTGQHADTIQGFLPCA